MGPKEVCSCGGEDDSRYLGDSGGREEEYTGHSPATARLSVQDLSHLRLD